MRWSDIKFHPDSRMLRQFAVIWIVFFLGLAAWQGWGHGRREVALVLVIVALSVGPLGMWRPQWIRPIYVGWTVAVFPIGWVVSHLVLGLIFYGLFTPISLVFRILGRDALGRHRPTHPSSYWHPKSTPTDVRSYFRQF